MIHASQSAYKFMLRICKLNVSEVFCRAEATLLFVPGSDSLWRLGSNELNPKGSIRPVECDVFA